MPKFGVLLLCYLVWETENEKFAAFAQLLNFPLGLKRKHRKKKKNISIHHRLRRLSLKNNKWMKIKRIM